MNKQSNNLPEPIDRRELTLKASPKEVKSRLLKLIKKELSGLEKQMGEPCEVVEKATPRGAMLLVQTKSGTPLMSFDLKDLAH